MECIEITLGDCKNELTFSAAVARAQKIFNKKFQGGINVTCAVCNEIIESQYRSAIRSFYGSNRLLIHPVHLECVKEHTPLDDLLQDGQKFIDMSTNDFIDLLGIISAASEFKKMSDSFFSLPTLNN